MRMIVKWISAVYNNIYIYIYTHHIRARDANFFICMFIEVSPRMIR